jgi:hypothetical protein
VDDAVQKVHSYAVTGRAGMGIRAIWRLIASIASSSREYFMR